MQGRTPAISVIIPTFQEEEYLATTLSRLTSTKSPVEVIVVDGGSQDNTVDIAKRFTNKVYRLSERGISKARNYGVKWSNADIVVFLDADVTPPNDLAEKVIETFKDQKVVGATCTVMPSRPRLAEQMFFLFYNQLIRVSSVFPITRFKRHSRGEFLAVRKREFQKVGGFNESIACLEDYDLASRLATLGKFAFMKNLTVYESMRRIRKLGLFKTVWTWSVNFLSYMLRGKPIAEVWQPVR